MTTPIRDVLVYMLVAGSVAVLALWMYRFLRRPSIADAGVAESRPQVFKEWADQGFPLPDEDFTYGAGNLRPIPYQQIALDELAQLYSVHDAGQLSGFRDFISFSNRKDTKASVLAGLQACPRTAALCEIALISWEECGNIDRLAREASVGGGAGTNRLRLRRGKPQNFPLPFSRGSAPFRYP